MYYIDEITAAVEQYNKHNNNAYVYIYTRKAVHYNIMYATPDSMTDLKFFPVSRALQKT